MAIINPHLTNYLTVEALELSQGDTKRIVCPMCSGGESKEESFKLTRQQSGVVTFVCFRAKCGFRGFLGSAPMLPIGEGEKTPPRPYQGALTLLPTDVEKYIKAKYLIHDTKDWRWSPSMKRIMMPIRNFQGKQVGWVGRGTSIHPYDGPKALCFYDSCENLYHVGN